MAKRFLERFFPDPKKIQNNKYLKVFGKLLDKPYLWRLNRSCTAKAFSIGLFVTFIPLPGHLLIAALLAILLRANLPISLTLAWIVNPLTMIPMYGFAYTIGAMLLGISLQNFSFNSLEWVEIWQPFLLGCLICGSLLAISGYFFVRVYWRYSVRKNWQRRQSRRSDYSVT